MPVTESRVNGRFPFNPPKLANFRLVQQNWTDHFGLVWPEYSGPALKVVHFDRSGHFGRSDRNVPFHLTKLLSPVLLFCTLLTRTITKRVAFENSRTEQVEFLTFQTGIFVKWKAPCDIKYLYQDWFEKSWMKICWRKLVNNLLERSYN